MKRQRPLAVLFDVGLVLLHPDGNKIAVALREEWDLHIDPFICYSAYPKTIHERDLYSEPNLGNEWFWSVWCKHAGIPDRLTEKVADTVGRIESSPGKLWTVQDRGAHKTLRGLKEAGIRLGIVCNASGDTLYHLEVAKMDHYFDGIIDSELAGVKKPEKQIFELGLDAVKVEDPGACWFVGDDLFHDIRPALSLGFGAAIHYDCLGIYAETHMYDHINRLEELLTLYRTENHE